MYPFNKRIVLEKNNKGINIETEESKDELSIYQEEVKIQNEELKLTRDNLEIEKDKYNTLFEFAPIPLVIIDKTMKIKEINNSASKMLNVEKKYLYNKIFLQYVIYENKDYFYLKINEINKKNLKFNSDNVMSMEIGIKGRGVDPICCELKITVVNEGLDSESLLISIMDIDDLKQKERKLKENQKELVIQINKKEKELVNAKEQFKTIADNLENYCIYVYTNKNQLPLLEGSNICKEMINEELNIVDNYDRKIKKNKLINECRSALNGKIRKFEIDRNERSFEVIIIPIYEENNSIRSVMGIVEDITEKKRLEEKVINSEKLSAIGMFAGSIAHEIRNPLSAIDSSVYYLRKITKDNDVIASHLKRIKSSIQIAAESINSMLELSRIKKQGSEVLNICSIIDNSLIYTHIPENIIIKKQFDNVNMYLLGDKRQLMIAISNLILNSVQAMINGGKLEITIEEKCDVELYQITIEDEGCGIKAEIINKVTEPMYTTKATGMGFGLAITKSIIENHKGTIDLYSQENVGTKVSVNLPIYRQ